MFLEQIRMAFVGYFWLNVSWWSPILEFMSLISLKMYYTTSLYLYCVLFCFLTSQNYASSELRAMGTLLPNVENSCFLHCIVRSERSCNKFEKSVVCHQSWHSQRREMFWNVVQLGETMYSVIEIRKLSILFIIVKPAKDMREHRSVVKIGGSSTSSK
jgi:hypothetical protein